MKPAGALRFILLLSITAVGCGAVGSHAPATTLMLAVHSIALPGAPAGGVSMDYLAYDRTRRRVWVPAGNTASGDVGDVTMERVTRVEGFCTAELERHGTKRIYVPTPAAGGTA